MPGLSTLPETTQTLLLPIMCLVSLDFYVTCLIET